MTSDKKKSIIVLALLAVFSANLFAVTPAYKLDVQNKILKIMGQLPNTGVYPKHTYQAKRIDDNPFIEDPVRTLQFDDINLTLGLEFNPVVYAHSNKENSSYDSFLTEPDIPFFNIYAMGEIGSSVFLNFQQNLMTTPARTKLENNLFSSMNMNLAATEPFSSGIIIANDMMSLDIARGPLKMDNGYTGNVTLNDNLLYTDYMKYSIYKDWFSYDFVISFYDRQYDQEDLDAINDPAKKPQLGAMNKVSSFSGPYQYFALHRMGFDIMDKVNISLFEGAMFYTNGFDLRALNPLMFMHNFLNFKNKDEANNILGMSITAVPLPGWGLHLQLICDQFQLPSEKKSGNDIPPNSIAGLFNTDYSFVTGGRDLHTIYFETIYSTPYFGLKQGAEDAYTHQPSGYNSDLIVGYKLSDQDDYKGFIVPQTNMMAPLGYTSDALTFALGYELIHDNDIHFDTSFIYRMHGEHGLGYGMGEASQEQIDDPYNLGNIALEIGKEAWDKISPSVSGNNRIEHMLAFKAGLKYNITKTFSVFTDTAFVQIFNFRNRPDMNITDFQFMAGISIKMF